MAKIDIPPAFIEGFEYFIALKDEERDHIVLAMQEAPVGAMPDTLSIAFAKQLGFEQEKLAAIIRMIFSFTGLEEETGMTTAAITDDIIKVLEVKAQKREALRPTGRLREHLLQLLNLDRSVNLTMKAATLLQSRDRILVDSRIITDIRPIFNDEENMDIKGALVTHTLKIEYQEGGDRKDIYLALDGEDLKKLSEYIQRAEKKEKAIRGKLQLSEINIVDLK